VGVFALVALLLLPGLLRVVNGRDCRNPYFIARNSPVQGNPIPPFADIIRQAGGLPRAGGEMDPDTFAFSSGAGIRPVTAYEIVYVRATDGQPLYTRALDDDPNYGLTVDVDITFADGTRRVMRWETWRYGLVLCPFVVPYGDGPPWRVAPVF
jgi:hypothetical protein